ncbi:44322_t:CDS:2 [Gigaspora margarita]|uniref:44322_t:CDS:1 n=1 Tax=Gigaspora margarita TaxID=4874 RepID=A0ABM8W4B3_GIGMA|nr:44322_t:CDS:2 [Gigaspora margarita]
MIAKKYYTPLKTSDIEVLSTKTVKSSKSLKDSWVWNYIKKDVLNKQVTYDIITVNLDRREKKCDKVYSISTSTTHLANIFDDKWLLLGDENLEQFEDSFEESAQQIFNTEFIPSMSNLSSISNLSSTSASSQSSTSNLLFIQKNQKIVEPICDVKTSKLLLENEWKELEKLIALLAPFAQMTESNEILLISSNILDICYQIEKSMLTRWEDPLIECYISSYLDPRFKNMNFISKKKKEYVQNKLIV